MERRGENKQRKDFVFLGVFDLLLLALVGYLYI